jgi:hypothetical protein
VVQLRVVGGQVVGSTASVSTPASQHGYVAAETPVVPVADRSAASVAVNLHRPPTAKAGPGRARPAWKYIRTSAVTG